jgi:hypothetical protein
MKYVYMDLRNPTNSCVVTSMVQLTAKTGMSGFQIRESIAGGKQFYEKHGGYIIQAVNVISDKGKRRKNNF